MNGSDKESEYDLSQEGWSKPSDESSQGSNVKNPTVNDNVHFKILVPSIAAGAIIGKGGEAIAQIQKDTGAKVKMSKANDFYPGTTERVCLILGTVDAIVKMHNYIMEKILEKAESTSKSQSDNRMLADRHRQVKILVPNSTAGMIIGKGGAFIKEIKDSSGAFIQISQKSREVNLPERCIVIAGEPDQNRKAATSILAKIAEDPQSASCPNISYADATGPVASAFPTGSPYANSSPPHSVPSHQMSSSVLYSPIGVQLASLPPTVGALQTHMSPVGSAGPQHILGTSTTFLTGQQNQQQMMGAHSHQSSSNVGSNSSFRTTSNLNMDSLRAALHYAGYPESASQEIAAAMQVLDRYGFINTSVLGGTATSCSPLAASVASQSVSNSAFGVSCSSGPYQTFSGSPSGPGTFTAAYGASPPSFGSATLLSPGSSYNFGQASIFPGYTTGPSSGGAGTQAISLPGHSSLSPEDFYLMSSPPDFATFSLYSPPLPQQHHTGLGFYGASSVTGANTAFTPTEFITQNTGSYNYVPVALPTQHMSSSSGILVDRSIEIPEMLPISTIEEIASAYETSVKGDRQFSESSSGHSTTRVVIIRGTDWNVAHTFAAISDAVQKFHRTNNSSISSSYSSGAVTQITSGVDDGSSGAVTTQNQ